MTDQAAQQRLFEAAQAGDKAAIRRMVFEDVDFTQRDEQGRTPFNIATQYNQIDTAQTILAAKQTKDLQKMGLISDDYQGADRRGQPARKTSAA